MIAQIVKLQKDSKVVALENMHYVQTVGLNQKPFTLPTKLLMRGTEERGRNNGSCKQDSDGLIVPTYKRRGFQKTRLDSRD